jgi:hypothetical protein
MLGMQMSIASSLRLQNLVAHRTASVGTRRSAGTGVVSTPALLPILAPPMQSALCVRTVSAATVRLDSQGTAFQIVTRFNHDQSAQQTQNVPWTKLASMNTASTLASWRIHVPHRLSALHGCTIQCAHVLRAMGEIHTASATDRSVGSTMTAHWTRHVSTRIA